MFLFCVLLFWLFSLQFSSVQSLSHVWLSVTPWPCPQASLSITNSGSLLKLMSIELVMPSNHSILCYPLLFLPSIFPRIRAFSNELTLSIRWPNYWSFQHPILPMNTQDWFPLGLTYLISLLPEELSRVFSNTTVLKHQFLGPQPSLWSNSHIHTWLLEKPSLWLCGPLSAKWYLCFLRNVNIMMCSLERLMLKLKLQYFAHLMRRANLL